MSMSCPGTLDRPKSLRIDVAMESLGAGLFEAVHTVSHLRAYMVQAAVLKHVF